MNCTCSYLRVGHMITESRNWNPDCEEHGVDSEWYLSPEQVAERKEQNQKLRYLYARVKAKRLEDK
jgi:hypothetical protein